MGFGGRLALAELRATPQEGAQMNTRRITLLVLSVTVGLTVLLCGCSPAPSPAAGSPSSATPEEVVESFYRWYIDYPGNQLADGAYRSSEYFT